MADSYSWAASVTGGSWGQAGNWTDTTTHTTAASPPGATNAATVTGGSGTNFQIVTGPGSAASLQMFGNTALEGSFAVGGLTVGSTASLLDAGAVDLETHSTLADSGPASLLGELELDGTGALFTTPLLTEAVAGRFYSLNGATLQAAAATIAGYFHADPRGVAEIGTLGGAGAGSLTVDGGATLTLVNDADITDTIALNGNLSALGTGFVEGAVNGSGTISVAATADLSIFGAVTGLATIADSGFLTADDTLATVGLLSLGTKATATVGDLAGIGAVTIGTGGMLSVNQDVTGGGSIEVGTSAALTISGTLSGLGRVDVGTGGTVAFTLLYGTLAPADLNVPLNLGSTTTLLMNTGVTIGGLVSGFATGDLIGVIGDDFNPAQLVTAASLAAGGGSLVLSDDGTVTNVIDLAGSFPGQQFLTNAVGLPGGLPTPVEFGVAGTTDIALSVGTITGLGTTGADTVTGALGFGFDVLAGTGTATALTFVDNIALEGSFVAAGITIASAATNAINALDLQTGATLAATGTATILSNAEVDGAGARFTAGTLAMNGGELLVVNGGTVQATVLNLKGSAGSSTLDVDAAGAIEIGTLADAITGALLVDGGATLTNTGDNLIIGTLVDQGVITLTNGSVDISFLTVDGTVAGSGVLNTGTTDTLVVDGDVVGLSQINAAASTNIDITGSLASSALVNLGTQAVLTVGSNVTGLAGLVVGTGGQVEVTGSMTGVGPVTLGTLAIADITGAVSGTGSFAVGPQGFVEIGGAFTGFTLASLGASATLSLGGSIGSLGGSIGSLGGSLTIVDVTDTVPILLGGTADTLDLAPGLTLTGGVTGFALGDLITVSQSLFAPGVLVTGASLAGGFLTLTSDGTVTDLVALAGDAGQQFLTNAVGLPDLTETDIVLPTATLATFGAGGTVTGASGDAFDVLTGSASSAALTFLGDIALEGTAIASGGATIGAGSLTGSVLDIEAGATLAATTGTIAGGVEVDGAGAGLVTAGTLTLGAGADAEQLYAANGGQVQAAAIVLTGGTVESLAELAVDPAGRIEIGIAGTGAAGTLTVDAGSTLTADATNSVIGGPLAVNGLVTVGGTGTDFDVLGTVSGVGTLLVGGGQEVQLAATTSLGTIAVGGTSFVSVTGNMAGVGTLTTGASTSVNVDGSVTGTGGISIGTSADLSIFGDLSGTGTLSIGAGAMAMVEGTVSGLSEIVIGAGGVLDLEGNELAVPILMEAGSTLEIQPFSTVTGLIQGFASGDAIAVAEAPYTIVTEADFAGGALTLSDDGKTVSALSLAGTYGLQQFLTNVAGPSPEEAVTDITLATPCFAAGTGLATARGRVAVEALEVGDAVRVVSGGTRPVVWIGRRRVDCRRHPHPELVWPVLVQAHAFAPGEPARDLRLSPDHAVFSDGVLIPVKHLINGRTIRQMRVAAVTYFHVELSAHDVLWAEGLPAESYLDTGNRAAFDGGAVVTLQPDFAPLSWDDACAELVQAGPRVAALKERLFARAGAGDEPARTLVVRCNGRSLAPDVVAPGVWRIAVPARARRLRLVSPAWMPAACDAASLDRRRLGVRLFGVTVDDRPACFGPGFHPVEHTAEGACRWTDGDATLLLPPSAGCVTLRVEDCILPGPSRSGKETERTFLGLFSKKN